MKKPVYSQWQDFEPKSPKYVQIHKLKVTPNVINKERKKALKRTSIYNLKIKRNCTKTYIKKNSLRCLYKIHKNLYIVSGIYQSFHYFKRHLYKNIHQNRNMFSTSSPCASARPHCRRNPLPHVSSTATSSRTSYCSSNTNTSSRRNVFANEPVDSIYPQMLDCSTCRRRVFHPCVSWCVLATTTVARTPYRRGCICRVACGFWCAFLTHREKRKLSRSTCSWIVFVVLQRRHSGTDGVLTIRRRWSSFCHSRGIGVAHPVAVSPSNLPRLAAARWLMSSDWAKIDPTMDRRVVVAGYANEYGVVIVNCHCMARWVPSPCTHDGKSMGWSCSEVGRMVLQRSYARFVGHTRRGWWRLRSAGGSVPVWWGGRCEVVAMAALEVMAAKTWQGMMVA